MASLLPTAIWLLVAYQAPKFDARFKGLERSPALAGFHEVPPGLMGSWSESRGLFLHRWFQSDDWRIEVGGVRYSSAEEREARMKEVHFTQAAHIPMKWDLDKHGLKLFYVGNPMCRLVSLTNGNEAVDVWLVTPPKLTPKLPDTKTSRQFEQLVLEVQRRLNPSSQKS